MLYCHWMMANQDVKSKKIMGQYRQWLHYNEIDQQLKRQLHAIDSEIEQLYSQIDNEISDSTYTNNSIIRAILVIQHAEQVLTDKKGLKKQAEKGKPADQPSLPDTDRQEKDQPAREIGSAASPPLVRREMTPPLPSMTPVHSIVASTRNTGRDEEHPGPSLVSTSIGTNGMNDLQGDIPRWLQNQRNVSPPEPHTTTAPVDQQSIRTNRMVERWFERWGHPPQAEIKQESKG